MDGLVDIDPVAMDVDSTLEQVAMLASLLNIDLALARRALEHCQWCFELAVDAACELAASDGAEAAASSSSSTDVHAGASSSTGVAIPPPSDLKRPAPEEPDVHASASSSTGVAIPPPSDLKRPAPEEPDVHASASSSTGVAIPLPADLKRPAPEEPDIYVGAKQPRLSDGAPVIKIPNSQDETPAPQPPMFQVHPLRDEQLRSLAWMIRKETEDIVRTEAGSVMRGGILADRMGYGKTSTTIGLISLDVDRPCKTPAGCTDSGRVPCDGTLIVCPPHLVEQWLDEFWKFLGPMGATICTCTRSTEKRSAPVSLTLPIEPDDFNLNRKDRVKFAASKSPFGIYARIRDRYTQEAVVTVVLSHQMENLRRIAAARQREKKSKGGKQPVRRLQPNDVISAVVFNCQKRRPDRCYESYTHTFHDGEIRRIVDEAIYAGFNETFGIDIVSVLARVLQVTFSGTIRFTKASSVQLVLARPPKRDASQLYSQRGTGPLKILALQQVHDLPRLQLRDLTPYHVVILPASIFSHEMYKGFFEGKGTLTGERLVSLASKVLRTRSEEQTWQQLLQFSPPLFEMIEWRRFVLDEFHESSCWQYSVRSRLQHLSAAHKWGLTGTPPFGSAADIALAATLLGYAVPPQAKDEGSFSQAGILGKAAADWRHRTWKEDFFRDPEHQRHLAKAVEAFVARCARQNATELVERIEVVEHDELVWHTAEERFLYRQACHDHGIFDLSSGYDELTLQSRAELLKRCAHFDMGEAPSAATAIEGLGSRKRDRVAKLTKQLWLEAARARVLSPAFVGAEGGISQLAGLEVALDQIKHPAAKSLLAQVLAAKRADVIDYLTTHCETPTGERQHQALDGLARSLDFEVAQLCEDGHLRLSPQLRLQQPIADKEYYKDEEQRYTIRHAVVTTASMHGVGDNHSQALSILEYSSAGRKPKRRRTVFSVMSAGFPELGVLLSAAHQSLDFYTRQLALMHKRGGCQECSICLGDLDDIAHMAMLPCSHVFHAECIRASLGLNAACPECRMAIPKMHVASELKSPVFRKHGSKLHAMAARLRAIQTEDPTAKVLVFVQWADLETKIWSTLKDYAIPFLKVSNITRAAMCAQDATVLKQFQNNKDSPSVLVLSLERAAAGANLTVANHVIFVHPMNAPEVSTAKAYERQALARVRRIGQSRTHVHVWRYITQQTVEQQIKRLHSVN